MPMELNRAVHTSDIDPVALERLGSVKVEGNSGLQLLSKELDSGD